MLLGPVVGCRRRPPPLRIPAARAWRCEGRGEAASDPAAAPRGGPSPLGPRHPRGLRQRPRRPIAARAPAVGACEQRRRRLTAQAALPLLLELRRPHRDDQLLCNGTDVQALPPSPLLFLGALQRRAEGHAVKNKNKTRLSGAALLRGALPRALGAAQAGACCCCACAACARCPGGDAPPQTAAQTSSALEGRPAPLDAPLPSVDGSPGPDRAGRARALRARLAQRRLPSTRAHHMGPSPFRDRSTSAPHIGLSGGTVAAFAAPVSCRPAAWGGRTKCSRRTVAAPQEARGGPEEIGVKRHAGRGRDRQTEAT